MRAVLLAAGVGARLRPLTDDRPKCLLEVGGEPLLIRTVRLLASRGIERFTVVDGYLGDLLRSRLCARFPAEWFRFVRNEEYASTNNAYSLGLARFKEEEPMFLLDSDLAFAPEVIDRILAAGWPNRLALRTRGELGEEEMKVQTRSDGVVTEIGKGIPPASAAGESMGLEIFSAEFTRELFATIEHRIRSGPGRDEFYEASFLELIRRGESVHTVDIGDSDCIEIDTVEDLARARALFGV